MPSNERSEGSYADDNLMNDGDISPTTEDTATTSSGSVMRSDLDVDASTSTPAVSAPGSASGNAMATKVNLPVTSPEETMNSLPPKNIRSRNDLTSLDASDVHVQHDHHSKRAGRNATSNAPHHVHPSTAASFSDSIHPKTMPAAAAKRKNKILETYPRQQHASDASRQIIVQLKALYQSRVRPIEQKFNLYNFCLPTHTEIHGSEFDANPMVLLLGQYSTGKTTFIRHLVGGDYPSMHIGPEPTTDRFTALIHGDDGGSDGPGEGEGHAHAEYSDDGDRAQEDDARNPSAFNAKDRWKKDGVNTSLGKTIKGNSLTVMPELPFSSLAKFGGGFLSHFVGSVTPAPLLRHVTLIDTPGVLSGEKQRLSRSYDFAQAARWFADRSDLILILFDAHKLDISDELKEVIEIIRPHNDDKIRCVLNKADGVTREQLVRVYGSLLWSMGKIFDAPEVVRVYTGSYWDEPLLHNDFAGMFESDEGLLIQELVNLPTSCAERKVNDVVKRIRIIKVHVCILTYLKSQTPRWFGKRKVQERLIENLEAIFDIVRIKYDLSSGDFPLLKEFAACLQEVDDFSTFVSADRKTLHLLDDLISSQIPDIMKGTAGITDPLSPKKKKRQDSSEEPAYTENSQECSDSFWQRFGGGKRRRMM